MKYHKEHKNVEVPKMIKPEEPKVDTYSFPGQYTTSNGFANKFTQDFVGSHKQCPSDNKHQQRKIVFDPTTQKINYT